MSKAGKILVANPKIKHPDFLRTVVLILKDEGKTTGMVLNRPTSDNLTKVFSHLNPKLKYENESPIYWGGPVIGSVTVLHHDIHAAEIGILPGLFLSGQTMNINKVVENGHFFRMFFNISVWGDGQLDYELKLGAWSIIDGSEDLIFSDPENVWNLAREKVEKNFLEKIGITDPPSDLSLN